MAEIKDKEYSILKENLDAMGKGAEKHKADAKHPLPPNITQQRYTDKEKELDKAFTKAQDAETAKKLAFDEYQAKFKDCENLKNTDSRTIKGIFGIYNEELRDFGIQPEKKREGRPPKPPKE